MKIKLIILLSLCSLFTCCKRANTSFSLSQLWNTEDDTIVVKRPLEPGLYQTKRIEYFLVIGKDTSNFKCIIAETKEEQKVGIGFDAKHSEEKSKLFRERMQELEAIVTKQAHKDFNLSRLDDFVFDFRSSGDLNIEITNEYERKIGSIRYLRKYSDMEDVIYNSSLKKYLNNIFQSYNVAVNKIDIEKPATTSIEVLSKESEIETDSAYLPKEVLDCIPIIVYFKAK